MSYANMAGAWCYGKPCCHYGHIGDQPKHARVNAVDGVSKTASVCEDGDGRYGASEEAGEERKGVDSLEVQPQPERWKGLREHLLLNDRDGRQVDIQGRDQHKKPAYGSGHQLGEQQLRSD